MFSFRHIFIAQKQRLTMLL